MKSRAVWAIRSEFVGFGDDRHATPNYGNLVGFALSSILANAYTPRASVGYEDTVHRYLIKIGVSMGMNVGRIWGVSPRQGAGSSLEIRRRAGDHLDALMNEVR